jgi:regulator of protease activity HflC (stomatin/prohibitin superfamily)
MMEMEIIALLVLVFVVLFFIKGIIIVQQGEAVVVERLGTYNRVLFAGMHFIIPVIENLRSIMWKKVIVSPGGTTRSMNIAQTRIDVRESVYDFPRQNVITKDNASISINALLYFQVMEPKSVAYEIQNLPEAIEKLTQTTLRNVVGEMDLDETFASRDNINTKLRLILDEASSKWGVKVNRVELQDIIPPENIQTAMEKQMKAERDKRAAILEAEGKKQAAILNAEGDKEAQINRAEGERRAAILIAEGQAEARAKQAEGEAVAIAKITEAFGSNVSADKYLIAIKYLETLKQMVEGENNKVVYLPFEATGVLSSLDGIKQLLETKK